MTSEERHEARYRRRKRKRQMKRWMRSQAVGTLEEVFNYRDMFYWGKKCCNGVLSFTYFLEQLREDGLF